MPATTERALPVFNQRQLAEAAARVLVLSGELLGGDMSVDVQSSFYASCNDEGLYLDAKRQKQDIQTLNMGVAPRFVFKKDNPLGGSAECFKETIYPRDGVFASRDRIAVDDQGRKIRTTEESADHRDEYEQVGAKRASVRTILAMAKEAMANVEPKPERELKDPLRRGLGDGERIVMLPEAFVPVLGRLAVVAADFVLERAPETSVDTQVQIMAWCQGMYPSSDIFNKNSNMVHFWGYNRATQIAATFKCEAYPIGHNELAIVTANMIVGDRNAGRERCTKDTVVKTGNGSLALERKVRELGKDPDLIEKQPADLETIVALAQRAVQLVRSES